MYIFVLCNCVETASKINKPGILKFDKQLYFGYLFPENVQIKYTNLRTSFRRELKKIQARNTESVGKTESPGSHWPLFNSMLFLVDVAEAAPICSISTIESQVSYCTEPFY